MAKVSWGGKAQMGHMHFVTDFTTVEKSIIIKP